MDSFETMQFSKFNAKDRVGSNGRLSAEACADGVTRKEQESTKPLKYYTAEFFEQDCANKKVNNLARGINFNDGYAPSGQLADLGTVFRLGKVGDKRCNGDLPSLPLPTTASFKSGQGNTDTEGKLRGVDARVLKSEIKPDDKFYSRFFAVFTDKIPSPMADIDHIVSDSPRSGVSTKGTVGKKYSRGRNC